MEFKTLTFPFRKCGFLHELIKREGLVCLVRRERVGYPGIPAHFEVIKLQQNRERTIGDRILEASESYPSEESWGTYGFTYRTVDKPERGGWTALPRFESLLRRAQPLEYPAFVMPKHQNAIQPPDQIDHTIPHIKIACMTETYNQES